MDGPLQDSKQPPRHRMEYRSRLNLSTAAQLSLRSRPETLLVMARGNSHSIAYPPDPGLLGRMT
jgi:hypothetical protein